MNTGLLELPSWSEVRWTAAKLLYQNPEDDPELAWLTARLNLQSVVQWQEICFERYEWVLDDLCGDIFATGRVMGAMDDHWLQQLEASPSLLYDYIERKMNKEGRIRAPSQHRVRWTEFPLLEDALPATTTTHSVMEEPEEEIAEDHFVMGYTRLMRLFVQEVTRPHMRRALPDGVKQLLEVKDDDNGIEVKNDAERTASKRVTILLNLMALWVQIHLGLEDGLDNPHPRSPDETWGIVTDLVGGKPPCRSRLTYRLKGAIFEAFKVLLRYGWGHFEEIREAVKIFSATVPNHRDITN